MSKTFLLQFREFAPILKGATEFSLPVAGYRSPYSSLADSGGSAVRQGNWVLRLDLVLPELAFCLFSVGISRYTMTLQTNFSTV